MLLKAGLSNVIMVTPLAVRIVVSLIQDILALEILDSVLIVLPGAETLLK
jgi:hypothetical protein